MTQTTKFKLPLMRMEMFTRQIANMEIFPDTDKMLNKIIKEAREVVKFLNEAVND